MSVVDELDRLAELRERGRISSAEYDEAKQQLLGVSRPALGVAHQYGPGPDGAYKATAYGALAAVTGVIALGALVGALLIRPSTSHAEAKDAGQPQLSARRSARR
jgi:hypothetical protein